MPVRERFERTSEAVQREADALVAALGDEWEAIHSNDCTWNFSVKNQQGHTLLVDLRDADKANNRKYEVRVQWPGGRSHRVNAPQDNKSFGCGYDRGSEALAQTIQKRVMPFVLEHWQERLDAVQKIEDDEDSMIVMVHRLEERFGRQQSEHPASRSTVYGSTKTGVHAVQLNHDGSRGTVDLSRSSLPMDLVFKLIDFLEENNAGD